MPKEKKLKWEPKSEASRQVADQYAKRMVEQGALRGVLPPVQPIEDLERIAELPSADTEE